MDFYKIRYELIIESFRKMTKLNIIILGLKPLLKKI